MNLDGQQRATIFQMLCLYRRHKGVFPEVILNYDHRSLQAFGPDRLGEALAGFRESPDKANFTTLFDTLKAIDQAIDATRSRQYLFEDGILLVGNPSWPAFSLVPGEYPFARLRFVQLSPRELEEYRRAPLVTLPHAAIKFATCSLGADARTQFGGTPNLRGGEYGLLAEAVAPAEALTQALQGSLRWAQESAADVVLLPELSVDLPGLEVVEAFLHENAPSGDLPRIIVAGSFYHRIGESYRNRATIYLTGPDAGTERPFYKLHYDKHVPFSVTVPADPAKTPEPQWRAIFQTAKEHGDTVVVEDFVSGADVTLVNTSSGMFGFAICRDVLDLAGVGNPLERYLDFVDFLMIISFNSGVTTLFEAQGEDLARWHNCAVVYVNAGQAVPKLADNDLVKMGYCISPYDKASSGIGGTIYYGKAPSSSFGHLAVNSLPPGGNVLYTLPLPVQP